MPKLLITDDDLHLRKLVRTYAEVDGYACEEAENGFQALEKLQCRQFDLMILDIMMPGMDGFETMAELRKFSRMAVGAARKDVTDAYGEPKKQDGGLLVYRASERAGEPALCFELEEDAVIAIFLATEQI